MTYRKRIGSVNPALANSTRTDGRVAEKRRVCLEVGKRAITSRSCSPKPSSNSLSPSSKITISENV